MERKNDKTLFGIMSILFNQYGVPQFMRGNSSEGVKHIILSIVTCGVMGIVYFVKGIISGIRVLKMTDEEYLNEKYASAAPAAPVAPAAAPAAYAAPSAPVEPAAPVEAPTAPAADPVTPAAPAVSIPPIQAPDQQG